MEHDILRRQDGSIHYDHYIARGRRARAQAAADLLRRPRNRPRRALKSGAALPALGVVLVALLWIAPNLV